MRTTQKRVRKQAAFAAALTMVVSLGSIAPTNAASKANNLVIAISEKDSGWCLQDSPGGEQILAKNQVTETLMTVNDKGKTVPYLASKVENSADFKTWKFTLREGIFFHDGEELTSATVLANVAGNLGLNPLIPASLPAIAWQDALGGVTSLAQYAAKVQAVGKYQVQFNLPAPRPLFQEIWGGRSTLWSTKTLSTKACGQTAGAGTGPFMIQSKGTDQFKTVLVANPNYWRKDSDGKSLPKAKTLTFLTIIEGAQRRNALLKGQADLATFGSTAGPLLNQMKKDKGIVLFEGPRDVTWSFHMNSVVPPFNSKNARLAFSYALDREALAKVVAKGNAEGAYCFGATYHPYNLSDGGKKKCVKSDLAKAKEYVAAYKTETGKQLSVVLPTTESQESIKYNQAICNMLIKAGATCSLMPPVTATAYILRGFALQQQVSNFNVVFGYSSSFADLFSRKTNLELSGFRFTNPGLAACFQTAVETNSKAKYQECVGVLHGDAYWIPAYNEGAFLGSREGLVFSEGLLPSKGKRRPIDARFDFATITVSG
jgi:ABC-type transport system substrate-binding protein